MSTRTLALMLLTLTLAACTKFEPGCGFGTSDAVLMARVKGEMKRQGIAYEELQNGMLQCGSADAERFHAALATAEAAYLKGFNDDMAGTVAILVENPEHAACLGAELARRQIPFKVGPFDGKQGVEWRPENEEGKQAVLAACKAKE
jgi:hypothetical protein